MQHRLKTARTTCTEGSRPHGHAAGAPDWLVKVTLEVTSLHRTHRRHLLLVGETQPVSALSTFPPQAVSCDKGSARVKKISITNFPLNIVIVALHLGSNQAQNSVFPFLKERMCNHTGCSFGLNPISITIFFLTLRAAQPPQAGDGPVCTLGMPGDAGRALGECLPR